MDTRLDKSVLIDLFNLPPLPDECNTEESYMDVTYCEIKLDPPIVTLIIILFHI